MANPYIYNVLTPAGAALIAQATAANPIVWVGALSKATAAASAEELSAKDASWYDGKAGEIVAVSATDNVARPVAAWRPSGVRQAALSLCVTARLASQTDADAVVMSAMSDPDSTVVLPGADDTGQTVGMPFPIDINASDTVAVTPGASASLADLERFVSMYKAGDPTQGDDQSIRGIKTFLDQIRADFVDLPANSQANGVVFNGNIIPNDDNVFGLGMTGYAWAGVRAWEVHTTELKNDLDSGTQPIYVYSSLRPNGNITLGDSTHPWLTVYTEAISLSNTRTIDIDGDSDNIQIDGSFFPKTSESSSLGDSGRRWKYLHCFEAVTETVTSPSRTCTLKASQSMIGDVRFICDIDSAPVQARIYTDDADSGEAATFYFDYEKFYAISSFDNVDLGTDDHKFGTVYARFFRGCIPTVDGNAEPGIGAIFFAGIEVSGAIANAPVGRTAKVGSPLIQGGSNITAIGSAIWDTQTGFSSYTPFSTTVGTYKLLCGVTKTGSDAVCFALVMRIA